MESSLVGTRPVSGGRFTQCGFSRFIVDHDDVPFSHSIFSACYRAPLFLLSLFLFVKLPDLGLPRDVGALYHILLLLVGMAIENEKIEKGGWNLGVRRWRKAKCDPRGGIAVF